MASSSLPPLPSPPPLPSAVSNHHSRSYSRDGGADTDDADTASQKSISLSSPPGSPRNSMRSDPDPRQSFATSSSGSYSYSRRDSEAYSGLDNDNASMYSHKGSSNVVADTPISSTTSSLYNGIDSKANRSSLPTYPPPQNHDDTASIASSSSKKARPESLLVTIPDGQLVLGVALVDFNHLVGPRIEYSQGDIFEDEEVAKILPFLALPDGAHMSAEDYSYFHIVKPGPAPTTFFGISCNQQIAASQLKVKAADVTRSTVQKAVVVLASKPVFGPIREKLRVVTTALFEQRDFSDYSILDAFSSTLEFSLRGQMTESGLYIGTNLRELVHAFRQKTLVLLKALILQKRIMFYGYPVERLCTFQYSLVSLIPGLLQHLDDCGSPPLASRAPTLSKPSELRTSDRKSMMTFMGLPLDIFGKDSFFQPYLPLQQLDMLHDTPSWLCGCTNSIVTQQKQIDLLVHTDTGAFEFRDQKLERSVSLTPADRKWMDEIITDVNEGWDEDDPGKPHGMKFKGSEDYLRAKFEEYIHSALATVKYRDFMAKGEHSGVLITGGAGNDSNAADDFNPLWIAEFKKTNAYEVWERITDPLLFDIVEPRHPCNEKPSVVADIGLRLQEGIQDLKLEQQLGPAREAVAKTFAAGSTNFFKAVEGVRGRWAQRTASSSSTQAPAPEPSRASTPPVEVSKADLEGEEAPKTATQSSFFRPFSLSSAKSVLTPSSDKSPTPSSDAPSSSAAAGTTSGSSNTSPSSSQSGLAGLAKPNLSSWSANINSFGSFLSTKAPKLSFGKQADPASPSVGSTASPTSPSPPPTAVPLSKDGARDLKDGKSALEGNSTTWSNFSALVSPPSFAQFAGNKRGSDGGQTGAEAGAGAGGVEPASAATGTVKPLSGVVETGAAGTVKPPSSPADPASAKGEKKDSESEYAGVAVAL